MDYQVDADAKDDTRVKALPATYSVIDKGLRGAAGQADAGCVVKELPAAQERFQACEGGGGGLFCWGT